MTAISSLLNLPTPPAAPVSGSHARGQGDGSDFGSLYQQSQRQSANPDPSDTSTTASSPASASTANPHLSSTAARHADGKATVAAPAHRAYGASSQSAAADRTGAGTGPVARSQAATDTATDTAQDTAKPGKAADDASADSPVAAKDAPDASALALLLQWSSPALVPTPPVAPHAGDGDPPASIQTDGISQALASAAASAAATGRPLSMHITPGDASLTAGPQPQLSGVADPATHAGATPAAAGEPAEATASTPPASNPAAAVPPAGAAAEAVKLAADHPGQSDDHAQISLDPGLNSLWAVTTPSTPAPGVAAPAAAATVAVQVDSPAFAAQLGQNISMLVKQDVQQARIQVSPQGMGPIDIQLHVANGVVDVNFAVQHPGTVHAIQQTLPQLDSLMSAQGLQLGQAHVGQQSAQSGMSDQGPRQQAAAAPQDTIDTPRAPVDSAAPVSLQARIGHRLVDHFV